MYEDTIKDISRTIKKLKDDWLIVSYLRGKIDILYGLERELHYAIYDLEQEKVSGLTKLKSTEAVKVLRQYALIAIRDTVEFNIGEYRERLLAAINDPRTIEITYDDSTGDVNVYIDLYRTAGGPEEYALGISTTREILSIGPNSKRPMSPELASYMWMEKYYKPAREGTEIPQPKEKERTSNRKERSDKKASREYDTAKYIAAYKNTMRTRLATFGGVAPFWFLIDQGNAGVELPSDWGGTPYPDLPPTRFVDKARRTIKAMISRDFKKHNTSYKDLKLEQTKIQKAIAYCEKVLQKVQDRINNLDVPIEQTEEPGTALAFDYVRIQLGERFGSADVEKLLELTRGIEQGTVDPTKRYTVTSKSGNRPVVIRIKNIYNLVQKYKNS